VSPSCKALPLDKLPNRPFDWRWLMSKTRGGYRTDWFPSHVSTVSFHWDYAGVMHVMHGAGRA
jgi:hypothetical protein